MEDKFEKLPRTTVAFFDDMHNFHFGKIGSIKGIYTIKYNDIKIIETPTTTHPKLKFNSNYVLLGFRINKKWVAIAIYKGPTASKKELAIFKLLEGDFL